MKAWSCQGLALAVVAAALLLHPAMANGANRKMLQTGENGPGLCSVD
jgi:hypothetical protein